MKAYEDLPPMTVDEFLTWSERQPTGRYELKDGRVVAMAAERAIHVRIKGEVFVSLHQALSEADSPCRAYTDGLQVRIDDATCYEPDVLVDCAPEFDPNTLEAQNPVIVVEVLSPSSEARDHVAKLGGYTKVPSIRHYLIVQPDTGTVVHHARQGESMSWTTTPHAGGTLRLDPPGVDLDLAALSA